MSNDEKIQIIKKMVEEFWEYGNNEEKKNGSATMISAIYTICTFGEEEDE